MSRASRRAPGERLVVGLDVRAALFGRSGFARVAAETHRALRRRPSLRVLGYGAAWRRPDEPVPEGVVHRRVPGRLQALLAPLGFGVETLLGELDVFHHLDLVYAPVRRAPEVLTIHDVCFLRDPAWHGAGFGRRVAPRLVRRAAAAAAIVVPSARVADDVVARGVADAARVHVVPHGADHVDPTPRPDDAARCGELLARAGLLGRVGPQERGQTERTATPRPRGPGEPLLGAGERLVLLPGTREPRKNQLALVEAFCALPPRPRHRLLLVGGRGWGCEQLERRLAALAGSGRVGTVGSVTHSELEVLLRCADVVAYPSLAEGFGLPVVEAMRCGRAVLTSAGTPMADLGGRAVLAVDATDAAALRSGLAALLADEVRRAELGRAAAAAVQGYTWDAAARRLEELYRAASAARC